MSAEPALDQRQQRHGSGDDGGGNDGRCLGAAGHERPGEPLATNAQALGAGRYLVRLIVVSRHVDSGKAARDLAETRGELQG